MQKCPTIIHKQERKCKNGHIWVLEDHLDNNDGWLGVTSYGSVVCPECDLPAKEHRTVDSISGKPYSTAEGFSPIKGSENG